MVDPILCQAQNPWRVPDWKWQRAVQIVDRQAPLATPTRDGKFPSMWIRRAVRFIRERRRIATLLPLQAQLAEYKLHDNFPDIYWAHMLYSTPERISARWAVEARILASQSDIQIAASNRCGAEMIATYAWIFFEVRGDLDRPEFILHSVFGDALYRDLNERDYGTLWKLMGFFGGASVVDCLTRRMMPGTRNKGAGGIPGFFQGITFDALKMKAAIATVTAPIDGKTRLPLLADFAKLLELERSTQPENGESSQIFENIRVMLSLIGKQFQVGSHVGVLKNSKLGEDLERGAVELRSSEMIRLANGLPVPELEELKKLKFPEPVNPLSGP